jgi:hypothetical protein
MEAIKQGAIKMVGKVDSLGVRSAEASFAKLMANRRYIVIRSDIGAFISVSSTIIAK